MASTYHPRAGSTATYAKVYPIFKGLHDMLGRERPGWLHDLKDLKRQASRSA